MTDLFKPSEGFKGLWIPICILIDPSLSLSQKIILSEIYQLQKNDSGECYASNAHFGAIANCKDRNVRDKLSDLVKKNLLWPYEATKRRRLAVTAQVREAIEGGSQVPVTRQLPAASAETNESNKKAKRQSAADRLGSQSRDPALERLMMRQSAATESTGRKQRKKTSESTTAFRNLMKSGGISADTHVRDSRGRALASVGAWKEWLSEYWPEPDAAPLSEAAQKMKLAEMVEEGFDGDELLGATIEAGMREFWCPPPWVVPEPLMEKYGYDERMKADPSLVDEGVDDEFPF